MIKFFTTLAFAHMQLVASTADPCSNMPSPPTVSSCWDCFQSLLADCDRKNPQGERRDACYTGANNFYTWCLGRISAPKQNAHLTTPALLETPGSYAFHATFEHRIDATDIQVFVRTFDGSTTEMTEAKIYTFATDTNSYDVLVDTSSYTTNVVGMVVRIEALQFARAFAVTSVMRGDLDRDGSLTDLDLMLLWERYAAGEISHAEFVQLLEILSK
jgi:uncharacterized membrane protein